MSDEKARKPIPLKIHLPEEIAQGRFSNMLFVGHNETEFVLDFIFVQPQEPGKANVAARIIATPKHAKLFLKAIAENVKKYEERFGEIVLPSVPPTGNVGFDN